MGRYLNSAYHSKGTTMKKLGLALFSLYSISASASDFNLTISVEDLSAGNDTVEVIENFNIDINIGANYTQANGVRNFSNGLAAPVTGTCFFTSEDGVFCDLQSQHWSYTIVLDQDFVGTVTATDGVGDFFDESQASITDIQ
jgi:hypothetical protein